MNLNEIVNRPDAAPIQEQEAYFVISEYVRVRKGKVVHPRLETRFGPLIAERDVMIMHQMLDYAIAWFRENPDKL